MKRGGGSKDGGEKENGMGGEKRKWDGRRERMPTNKRRKKK